MTPVELQALDCVREWIVQRGVAPTYAEIARECGLRSRASAHRLVEALLGSGHLTREPGQRRGLGLPGLPDLRAIDSDVLLAELRRRAIIPGAFSPGQPREGSRSATCAVRSCGTPVQRGHMFCREHYWSITETTRTRLFRAHRLFRSSRTRPNERAFQEIYQVALAEATAPEFGSFG